MRPRPLLIPAISLFLSASLLAQSNQPVDPQAMLQALQDIKQKQSDSAKSQLVNTIRDFSGAAASDGAALDFYIQAVDTTEFVGRPREVTSLIEWKKKELPRINGTAVRTCLRYMVISMQRAAGATDAQIFPSVIAYAQDTEALLPVMGDQPILQEGIADNIFSKWYNLNGQLAGLQNWEASPGNIDGIYETFLLPYMRQTKDPRIINYWDDKIANETARASSSAAAFNTDRFNLTRRPQLLWERARDMIVIGNRDAGLNEMFTIVKTFPTHPDAGKWIDELKGLLRAAAASKTPARQ
jgi:hypothetical protein